MLGFAAFQCLESPQLFPRLGSPELSGFVRQNAGGRCLIISALSVPRGENQEELGQLLLTEVLALGLGQELSYACLLYTSWTGQGPYRPPPWSGSYPPGRTAQTPAPDGRREYRCRYPGQ